jgi:hypothetical protein
MDQVFSAEISYSTTRHAGVARMSDYRLYFMDRFSGHIDHRREFMADDDAGALRVAEDWNNGDPMELWEGGRKLKRWEAAEGMPLAAEPFTSAGE